MARSEFRVLMLGKEGVGKSALGNLLLNDPRRFEEHFGFGSTAVKAEIGEGQLVDGVRMHVIDITGVPVGVQLAKEDHQEWLREAKRVLRSGPGVDAILYVHQASDRFVDEDRHMLKRFFQNDSFWSRVVVVFSHASELGSTDEEQQRQFIKDTAESARAPQSFKWLMNNVGNRFVTAELVRCSPEYRDRIAEEIYNLLNQMYGTRLSSTSIISAYESFLEYRYPKVPPPPAVPVERVWYHYLERACVFVKDAVQACVCCIVQDYNAGAEKADALVPRNSAPAFVKKGFVITAAFCFVLVMCVYRAIRACVCCCYRSLGNFFCFPEDAVLQLESGKKLMKDLCVGDKVLCFKGNGSLEFSDVIAFIYYKPYATAQYLKIETKLGSAITISANHFIFTANNKPVLAGEIKEGDSLIVCDEQNQPATSQVTKIHTVQKQGVYAPLTRSGVIVVDGVMASCYASFHSHDLAHVAFAPLRLYSSISKGPRQPKEGIHGYAAALYKFL